MSRFLATTLASSFFISWCSTHITWIKNDKIDRTISSTYDDTSKILESDNDNYLRSILYKINRSVALVWDREFNFFVMFFWLKSDIKIVEKIMEIQKKNNLVIDWIIWKNTLSVVYSEYYSNINTIDLPRYISNRLNIYNDLNYYKSHPWRDTLHWRLFPFWLPNVYSNTYYYWKNDWFNLKDSYINESLVSKVPDIIEEKWNIWFLENIDWKFLVRVYVNWKLTLLSYTSPWTDNINWWIRTTKWNFISKRSSKYHISWAIESIKKTKSWLKWAVMPYAVHIYRWIYAHAWYVDWTRKSHWCVRLPILYAKWLYDIFKKNWDIKWYIIDN